MGRFIVIDGLDGSGKETQAHLLIEYLNKKGIAAKYLSFPCYESDSSLFVKKYLSGELGNKPEDTGAYAASMFFACDRYISFKQNWSKEYYDKNTVVIANRYTTANAVHQASKISSDKQDEFLEWLWDFEFDKLGLPEPDDVIYLEMLPEISEMLIRRRSDSTGRKMDIHEKDEGFLERSYSAAMNASEKLGWKRIKCYDDEKKPLTIEEIHNEIINVLGI